MPLYIIATPLGNLDDISIRAKEILNRVDFILAEDTRRTVKLLSAFKISKKLVSFHEHSSQPQIAAIISDLKQGKSMSLVTDAGTPAISDPGGKLIGALYNQAPEVKIIPIPGPSAITTLLSISGFNANKFTFFGFPPKKRKRAKFFQEIVDSPNTAVFFSPPHGILKDLEQFKALGIGTRIVLVGREMTKIFETFYRGTIEQVIEGIQKDPCKGEYTVAISGKK